MGLHNYVLGVEFVFHDLIGKTTFDIIVSLENSNPSVQVVVDVSKVS
jgi:hypothetical protein